MNDISALHCLQTRAECVSSGSIKSLNESFLAQELWREINRRAKRGAKDIGKGIRGSVVLLTSILLPLLQMETATVRGAVSLRNIVLITAS